MAEQSLAGFLNPKKIEYAKVVVSDRFCDDNGGSIEWELRPISGKEITEIQGQCAVIKRVNGKAKTEFNNEKFQALLVSRSVVYPDPANAELLSMYGVTAPEELFGQMLTGAEFLQLYTQVAHVNGLDKDINELVQDAKN